MNKVLVGPFSQIIPLTGVADKGPLPDSRIEIIPDGGVLVANGRVTAAGDFMQLRKAHSDAVILERSGPGVLLPGFIDCHTHICFAGSRAADFALKLQGVSYLDIARQGGGILHTVQQTRLATEQSLLQQMLLRAERHFSEGVTTIEVKSGYGLNVDDELKMLRAIKGAALQLRASVIPTCLAAHTIPPGYAGNAKGYLDMVLHDLLPEVKKEGLAGRVDIFTEDTAFGIAASVGYLQQAAHIGFDVTVHADQFTAGAARMAASLGAVSADHLEAVTADEIQTLANSRTVAVVLPGASLGLGISFAPARKMLDAGCCLAIASDWNPGSAPMGDLLTQASIMAVYEKLSFTETLAGITRRAAVALRLHDRGMLAEGFRADMAAFPTNDYRDILYFQGKMKPDFVRAAEDFAVHL